VVRNAVCHGIEPPDERLARGKAAVGRVTLEAARSGNTVILSVRDDGRGLNYEAIAAKGRRLGLLATGETPSIERLNALIFRSGFSTRDEAGAIAGRGVGMDVVSQEVGRLHGTITLTSNPGEGTRLSISLPARLALEQAMISHVDGRPFALPVELIEQAQTFEPETVDHSAAWPRLPIRDRLVPLIDARKALGISKAATAACPRVISIRADGEPLAVIFDAIQGTAELAIKPLSPLLSGHPVVSGTSLSASGEVIFALDPAGLARTLRDVSGSLDSRTAAIDPPSTSRVLVVDDSISVRKIVARHLKGLGFEVEEVSDGLEALGKLRNHTYALVVSDLEMPRMDGFELLAELGRLGISPRLPVFIASTRSGPETRSRAIELGARGFLPKPIVPEELAAKIRAVIEDPGNERRHPEARRETVEHAQACS
jgi:chemotaxis protein histidine kinase CheA